MLQIYRCLTIFFFPFAQLLIFCRVIFNKEDKIRYKEKIFASCFRPKRNLNKKLYWFHVASVGELISVLPLISDINSLNKSVDFLITTVTLSSARLVEKKLNKYNNITHRYFPLDTKRLSEEFLNVWRPNLIFFVDSEIWPNFLFKIKEKNIPLLLINARLTKKSFYRWKIIINFAKKVFGNFDLCLSASKESKKNLNILQVKNLQYIGNLKYTAKNIPEELGHANKKKLNNFKSWCAVSTHDGEELIILKAHLEIKKKYDNVLTIIVPRHIDRSSYVKNLANKFSLNSQVLNNEDLINSETEILIINSFGVLPKYFNYCKNVFIGKSFVKKLKNVSGQNPIEAAKFGCKIFHGPYVYNFLEIYEHLRSFDITEMVNNELELAKKIIINFENQMINNQNQVNLLDSYGEKILKKTALELNKYLK